MRIKEVDNGYYMYLTGHDTYNWAHREGLNWPGSVLSSRSLFVLVSKNGLLDITQNGRDAIDIPHNELIACISDHLPKKLQRFWPVWK